MVAADTQTHGVRKFLFYDCCCCCFYSYLRMPMCCFSYVISNVYRHRVYVWQAARMNFHTHYSTKRDKHNVEMFIYFYLTLENNHRQRCVFFSSAQFDSQQHIFDIHCIGFVCKIFLFNFIITMIQNQFIW